MAYLGIANNEKLIKLYNEMKEGLLILKPAFQRNLVWSDKHKEYFIETILKGLPFPEVYLCEGEVDIKLQKSTRLVVDGQQRLSTIYQYINGDLKRKKIPSFSKIGDDAKKEFFNYWIVVRDLGVIDENKIREVFKRINSVQYALNAMEIRNALYEGEFISIAKEVSASADLGKLEIFSESQDARMKDADFIILIMSTLEVGGYFSRDEEVENLIKTYDNNYPNKSKIKNSILEIFKLISKANLDYDSIWFRKSSFFTLVVELIKHYYKKEKLPSPKSLRKMLEELESLIDKNRSGDIDKNQYARYYYYVYQGTASKTGRIARGEVLQRHLEKI